MRVAANSELVVLGVVTFLFALLLLVVPLPSHGQQVLDGGTVLLLHADGADASTTFTDSSVSGHTVTPSGNAQIDTAQSEFGGASALFDGTGDYLSIPASGSWDFWNPSDKATIDMWVRTSSTGLLALVTRWVNSSFGTGSWGLYINNGALYIAHRNSSGADTAPFATGGDVDDGAWHHIAYVKDDINHYLFVDGVQVDFQSESFTGAANSAALEIGRDLHSGDGFRYFNGHIDELRISKGIARWTSDFTPPTSAHSPEENPAEFSTVDSSTENGVSWGAARRVVFTSSLVGYAFYRDTGGACVYSKTSNGGATWGSAVTVDAQTDCLRITVWYDKWTPGDSGTIIHIGTMDAADLWYNTLDTSGDTVGTVINASAANQAGGFAAAANFNTITKGTDGTLYMGVTDNSDSFVIECSTTCGTATNWTETGTNPLDLVTDDVTILLPLTGGHILAIQDDVSADVMRSKRWDNTGAAWDAAWTTIESSIGENTTYEGSFSASVNLNTSTSTVYLAYLDDTATLDGDDDDILTAKYAVGVWSTAIADVVTNSNLAITNVSLGLSGNNVVVGYTAGESGALTKLYIAGSDNGMTSWVFNEAPAFSATYDIRDLSFDANNTVLIGGVFYDLTSSDQLAFTVAPTLKFDDATIITDNVTVTATTSVIGGISKGSGSFVIDHPLDPLKKLLYHSFVESPDVKNIYDGIAELDGNGNATIELPSYFLALNRDFRYLATAMGEPMPDLHLSLEVRKKFFGLFGTPIFKIAGGVPSGKVSWQVTGIRHDPLIEFANFQVEAFKTPTSVVKQGECLYAPLCR